MTYQPWTFGGINFYVESDGGFTPMPISADQYQTTHIPGGNYNYVDYGGQGPLTLTVTVIIPWTSKAAFFAKRGTRASLTVPQDVGGDVFTDTLLASLVDLRTDSNREFVMFEAVWLLGSI